MIDKAEIALQNLGEELYKHEATKFANLLLSSPYLDEPEKFAKCYIRVIKTKSQEEKDQFFTNDVMSMRDKAKNAFESDDLDLTKKWMDACDTFNNAKLGKSIKLDELKLAYFKKLKEKGDESEDTKN